MITGKILVDASIFSIFSARGGGRGSPRRQGGCLRRIRDFGGGGGG